MFRTALISLFLTSTALADTWTVDDDGKADSDNIQAAVDAASDGDEIIVMPGTYTSTADEVVDMRGKEVWLHSSAGAEVTFIDGEGARRGIVCINNETVNTIIEGFTITNGYTSNNGGGMFNDNGSPTLTGCTFTNNNTDGKGGGMYNDKSNPVLTNCTFENNRALGDFGDGGGGGGMYNVNSSPTLTSCTFENNTAAIGGGMYSRDIYDDSEETTLESCTFNNNHASSYPYPWGGGIYLVGSSIVVKNSTFKNNTSEYVGGAIGGAGFNPQGTWGSIYLYNCEFENNSTVTSGGACSFGFGLAVEIDQCTFLNNTIHASIGSYGGLGGAIGIQIIPSDDTKAPTVIKNSTFDNNYAINDEGYGYGGAIMFNVYGVLPPVCLIENCSFAGNEATTSGGAICQIQQTTEYLNISDSTFCESTPNHIDGKLPWIDGGGNTFADECPIDCPDINGDGYVDASDLLAIIDQWGLANSPADVNEDGIVDVSDILIVIDNWGVCE